jgi:sulfotransferase
MHLDLNIMISKQYFFISGLPRSGSTLLSALLRQNPDFEANITSPVGGIMYAVRQITSSNIEFDAQLQDVQRKSILRGIMDSYYASNTQPYIFDTNRSWTGRIPELQALFGNVKVIAMVRNPAWILDSVENITRANPLRNSSIKTQGTTTLEMRIEHYMSKEGLVGFPMSSLKEGIFGPESHNILVVEYEALCLDTENVMSEIYRFLELPKFEHDNQNVEFSADGFDEVLKTPGLHKVKGPVKLKRRNTILGQELFERFSKESFWRGDIQTKSSRIVLS